MKCQKLHHNICPTCGKSFYTAQPADHCVKCGHLFSHPATQPEPQGYDFDGGFGIGGINRYQPTAAEEMARIDAMTAHAERDAKRVRTGPRGQLWQECDKPGCHNEPVCANCMLCHEHCNC